MSTPTYQEIFDQLTDSQKAETAKSFVEAWKNLMPGLKYTSLTNLERFLKGHSVEINGVNHFIPGIVVAVKMKLTRFSLYGYTNGFNVVV